MNEREIDQPGLDAGQAVAKVPQVHSPMTIGTARG